MFVCRGGGGVGGFTCAEHKRRRSPSHSPCLLFASGACHAEFNYPPPGGGALPTVEYTVYTGIYKGVPFLNLQYSKG